MNDVFISYAKEDESVVQIINKRLTNSGLKVWDYKTSSQPGLDLETEYKYQIERSKFFLLIDSHFARKSKHVQAECEIVRKLGMQKVDSIPFIRICVAEKAGKWQEKNQLFERQSQLTSIFLNESLDWGIKKLCDAMGSTLVVEPMNPSDKDFIEEFAKIKLNRNNNSSIKSEELRAIMNSYENYQCAIEKNDIAKMENELNSIYLKCKDKNLAFPGIYLSLASIYKKCDELKKAQGVLETGVKNFADDPRIYAALAACYFYLADYKKSMETYESCIKLIAKSLNPKHKEQYNVIILSMINVSLIANKPNENFLELFKLNKEMENDPDLNIISGQVFYQKKEVKLALVFYEKAFSILLNSTAILFHKDYLYDLIFCISQCYFELKMYKEEGKILQKGMRIYPDDTAIKWKYAKHLLYTDQVHKGINWMEKLSGLKPQIIKYHVELAATFQHLNYSLQYRRHLNSCFDLEKSNNIVSYEDKYYMGWAYYLKGDGAKARFYFDLSKNDRLINEWVYYSEL